MKRCIIILLLLSVSLVYAENSTSFPINHSILILSNCYDKVYFNLLNSTMNISDNEYIISPGCVGNTTNNSWVCNCSNNFYINTQLNTVNNYTFKINYNTEYLVSSTSGGGTTGGGWINTIPSKNISNNISSTNTTIEKPVINNTQIINETIPQINIPSIVDNTINITTNINTLDIIKNNDTTNLKYYIIGGLLIIIISITFIIIIFNKKGEKND